MTTRVLSDRRLLVLAILLSALVSAATIISGFLWYTLAAFVCLLLFTLFLVNVRWGAYVLLLASACTAISFEVGPFTVRPEQVITLILAVIVFIFLVSGKRPVYTTALDWLILSYLLVNVISSLLHSPDVRTSLQKCALLTITFTAYFVSTQIITTRKVLSGLVSFLIVLGVVEAIYGIVSVALFTSGVDIGGAHAPYGDVYARGTFIEGNIFGSFEMMVALILTSFLLSKHFSERRGMILIALVITLVASIMSFTRAAWLGFIAGFAAYIFFLRRGLLVRAIRLLPLILITVLLLGTAAYSLSISIRKGSVSLMDLYIDRFQKILDYRATNSSSARVIVWEESIRLWHRNPILGNGTDSIKSLAVGSNIPMFGTEYWIPNSLILALHDTGIVGLALFCAIQVVFLMKLRRAMRKTSSAYHQAVLEGFFAAFIGAQLAYFFTNAFWLIFIWIFMAIGISCCRLALHPSTDPASD